MDILSSSGVTNQFYDISTGIGSSVGVSGVAGQSTGLSEMESSRDVGGDSISLSDGAQSALVDEPGNESGLFATASMDPDCDAQEQKALEIGGKDGIDNNFDITVEADGSCKVVVNGEEKTYSAEEAQKMIVNCGQGNDSVSIHQNGTSENDITVNGENGNDRIVADENVKCRLNLNGGVGDDVLIGGSGRNAIHGGAGNDELSARDGWNKLYGEDGNDVITGGAGRDYISGGAGDDVIHGGDGGDVIYGGSGNDAIYGEAGNDFINSGSGDDKVYGGEGNDVLFGLSGNDELHGEAGTDVLIGGLGEDLLDGGEGADKIRQTSGECGADQVISDGNDDVKDLNSIPVPDKFDFKGQGASDGEFKSVIQDNLSAFADCEPGQELLTKFDATGKHIDFFSIDMDNGMCSPVGIPRFGINGRAAVWTDEDGKRQWAPRIGVNSAVILNPSFIGDGDDILQEQNSMVIMAHEMCHAYNNATGTADPAFYNNETGALDTGSGADALFSNPNETRLVSGAEFQAVGIYDNSTISPNPWGVAENDYREYFNLPLRTSYLEQSDAQKAVSASSNPLAH